MVKINKMRAQRLALGLTQEEFADALGTSQSTVSRWESEGLSPTIDDLRIMVKKFGAKIDINLVVGI